MDKKYKISLVGSGNVAWHLSKALEDAGHFILDVYSRDIKNAGKLSERLYNAIPTDSLDFSNSEAQVFFICVPDAAIAEIAGEIILPANGIVAHTSGSLPLKVLHADKKFVFYPVQTFSKDRKLNFERIPICLEGSDEETEKVMYEIATSLSKHVCYMDSEQRKVLHVAAVFANNFTNHLLGISKGILEEEGIDFKIILPLVGETMSKAFEGDPDKMQTGPAVRRDMSVLKAHVQFLENTPEWQNIYKAVSESIVKAKIV